ncbi:MAG: tetratricopeptide repeat protein [archaeon]
MAQVESGGIEKKIKNREIEVERTIIKNSTGLDEIIIPLPKVKGFENIRIIKDKDESEGIKHMCDDNYQLARKYYLGKVKEDSYDSMSWNNYAVVFEWAGVSKNKIRIYEKALKINDNNSVALFNLGMHQILEKRVRKKKSDFYSKGISNLKKAAKLAPKNVHMQYFTGVALEINNRHTEAISYFKKALKLDPENIKAQYGIGFTYLKWKNKTAALRELKKALELDPEHIDAHIGLSQIYRENGRVDKAIQHVNMALEQIPSYLPALKEKRLVEDQAGHGVESIKTSMKIMKVKMGF